MLDSLVITHDSQTTALDSNTTVLNHILMHLAHRVHAIVIDQSTSTVLGSKAMMCGSLTYMHTYQGDILTFLDKNEPLSLYRYKLALGVAQCLPRCSSYV